MTPPFVYFDTSVVVKRYVWEPSSAVARTLLRRYRCLFSAILPVEVMSAVNRRQATGDLATADFSAILSRIGEEIDHRGGESLRRIDHSLVSDRHSTAGHHRPAMPWSAGRRG